MADVPHHIAGRLTIMAALVAIQSEMNGTARNDIKNNTTDPHEYAAGISVMIRLRSDALAQQPDALRINNEGDPEPLKWLTSLLVELDDLGKVYAGQYDMAIEKIKESEDYKNKILTYGTGIVARAIQDQQAAFRHAQDEWFNMTFNKCPYCHYLMGSHLDFCPHCMARFNIR